MYDGPEQEKFLDMTKKANVPKDFVILEIDGMMKQKIMV